MNDVFDYDDNDTDVLKQLPSNGSLDGGQQQTMILYRAYCTYILGANISNTIHDLTFQHCLKKFNHCLISHVFVK